MRIAITAVLTFISLVSASAAEPAPEDLDSVLKAVEMRMKGVDAFRARCTRTVTNGLTKKQEVFTGELIWQRPDRLRVDLTHADEANKKEAERTRFERIIFDGKNVYEYSPSDKLIVVHAAPKNLDDNLLFAVMKGVKGDELKKRFDMTLGFDKSALYAIIDLSPKTDADRQEFKLARIWVYRDIPNRPDLKNTLCQIQLFQPNGNDVKYWFTMQLNAKLEENVFKPTSIPGYTQRRADVAASPKAP